jgi:hypothetical protein
MGCCAVIGTLYGSLGAHARRRGTTRPRDLLTQITAVPGPIYGPICDFMGHTLHRYIYSTTHTCPSLYCSRCPVPLSPANRWGEGHWVPARTSHLLHECSWFRSVCTGLLGGVQQRLRSCFVARHQRVYLQRQHAAAASVRSWLG